MSFINYLLCPWNFKVFFIKTSQLLTLNKLYFQRDTSSMLEMGTPRGSRQTYQCSCLVPTQTEELLGFPTCVICIHMNDYSIDMIQQDKFDHSFSSPMSASPMNRMAPDNPQPDPFIHMNDSSMNFIPQNPAGPTIWKRHQKLTSFMHTQYKELRLCLATPHFQIKISRRNWLWNSTYWIGDNNKDLGQEPASQSEEEAATTANSKANKPDSSSQECAHLTHNIKQSLFFFSCSFRFL